MSDDCFIFINSVHKDELYINLMTAIEMYTKMKQGAFD